MTIKLRIIQTLLLSVLMGAGIFMPGCSSSQPPTPCCTHSHPAPAAPTKQPAPVASPRPTQAPVNHPGPAPAANPSSAQSTGDILDLMNFYSTPYDSGTDKLTDLMDWSWQDKSEAHPEVVVADFTYTDEIINDKLCWLSQVKQVKVRMILDKLQTNSIRKKMPGRNGKKQVVFVEQVLIEKLSAAGVEVVIGSSEGGSIMHNKMIVVNRKWFYDGTMNFTAVANKQNNHLWITKKDRPQPRAAAVLLEDWQKMYDFIVYDKRQVKEGKKYRLYK